MSRKLFNNLSHHNKKGATSLYVVVFTSILFGVITLSFLRLVLSESSQSSNDDLSRSAYDAAMAGVEDAKTAVNRYYNCLGGVGSSSYCDSTAWNNLFGDQDCSNNDGIGLARYLYGSNYSDGEVLIQQNNIANQADNNSDQAYTCVVISDVVQDYRGTLTSDTRTKVVPLRIYDGSHAATEGAINKVVFQWYSSMNEGTQNLNSTKVLAPYTDGQPRFNADGGKTVPPTVQLTYIKVGPNFSVSNFHQANSSGYEYSTMVILPSTVTTSGSPQLTITNSMRVAAGNISYGDNTPFEVECSTTREFACSVVLTDAGIGSQDTAFLVVSLPYKETVSDFKVELRQGGGGAETIVPFEGVQVSVDSTGRTGQLVRRVETRLDPADLFFPYPQYALEIDSNSGGDVLKKDFWITANCWYSQPATGGYAKICDNNNG